MNKKRSTEQLRRDALQIWRAGLRAVDSRELMLERVRVEESLLWLADESVELDRIDRIVVVGAGKAGAGMAAGLEEALGEQVAEEKRLEGWVNVPSDCVGPLRRIRLHAARGPGQNEPTVEGAAGAEAILKLVSSLDERDLCIVLLSGGGSALLPAPISEITLADKTAVTRHLSAAGANIEQMNTVRRCLSRIKGGGLAAACRAGRLVSLILSDVLGDPLEVIASGPTVVTNDAPAEALAVLEQFDARDAGISDVVFDALKSAPCKPRPTCEVSHHILGNNATAVDAAGAEAERLGYTHAMTSAARAEAGAERVGRHLAQMAHHMRQTPGPDCLISGGEPVVQLVDERLRGRGGRNQQLALAALAHLIDSSSDLQGVARTDLQGVALLAGGTDGEDGPTDAAGARIDQLLAQRARELRLDPNDFLRRNDAYSFFEAAGGLIKTGPTHTNVCDLRVVLVDRIESA